MALNPPNLSRLLIITENSKTSTGPQEGFRSFRKEIEPFIKMARPLIGLQGLFKTPQGPEGLTPQMRNICTEKLVFCGSVGFGEKNQGFLVLGFLKEGFCPGEIREGANYRFECWKRRRALGWPYFLRSTIRGSRVRKPSLRRADRVLGSMATMARANAIRMAPAWPVTPPP